MKRLAQDLCNFIIIKNIETYKYRHKQMLSLERIKRRKIKMIILIVSTGSELLVDGDV